MSLICHLKIINAMLPSNSVGKSLVSYVTGHAICKGYISNVDFLSVESLGHTRVLSLRLR